MSKLVMVSWDDSSIRGGWTPKEDISRYCVVTHCCSVGILVDQTDQHVTVAGSIASGGDAADLMSIPRSAIKSIRTLKVGANAG